MTSDRWKIIEDLFYRALNLDPAERGAFLKTEAQDAEVRKEVFALLASDIENEGFVEKRVAEGIADFRKTRNVPINRQVGPYLLTRELGRGGMGAVYLGERADGQYKGEAAVKLVRPGMDTDFFLERFSRERQALARLQHPNIARLLDSGTTEDGIPYIVMERVEGKPINAYCRERKLSIHQILRLYLPVCQAVAHAHHHFIVHRDLKPGNILVESTGTPKLLDFGICKLIEDAAGSGTMTGTHLLTPDYASPEQVRGDLITVASDVYSLGAVLYELLTGCLPHAIPKYTPEAIVRAVCEEEVVRPSIAAAKTDPGRARQLMGDLDTILLMALNKAAERRYASVEQFNEDLRRVLAHEPVMARPDTAIYRARKFARRHRAGVVTSALLATSLTVGLIGYARQATIAQRQFAEARRLANAMMFDIHDRIRNLQGSLAAREAILSTGLVYLDRMAAEANQDESLRRDLAAAYHRMGDIQGNVLESYTGDTDAALVSYRKGLAAIEPVAASREAGLIRFGLLVSVGRLLESRGETEAALDNVSQAIAVGTRLHADYPDDDEIGSHLAEAYSLTATALRRVEQRQRALDASIRSAEITREMLARHPNDRQLLSALADALSGVGTARATLSMPGARETLQESIALWNTLHEQDPTNKGYQRNRMLAYSHLGDLLGNPNYPNLGDTDGALAAFQSMLAIADELYRANPGDQGSTIDYGMALSRVAALPLGKANERIDMYKKAAEVLDAARKTDPSNANLQINLAAQNVQRGELLLGEGRPDEARQAFRSGLAIAEPFSRPAAQRIVLSISQRLGEMAARRGDRAEALAYANRAIKVGEEAAVPGAELQQQLLKARGYATMGLICELLHRPATQWLERALEQFHAYAGDPAFTSLNQEQMEQVEIALKRQTRRP